MKNFDRILQEALIRNNVLTEDEAHQALLSAQKLNESFKEYLLRNSLVKEKQLLIALSQTLNLEMIDLRNVSIEPAVLDLVPIRFAWYYKILPIRLQGNSLVIASANPLELKKQDEIRVHVGKEVVVVLAQESELGEALKRSYGFASDTIDKIMAKEQFTPEEVTVSSGQWIEDLERKSEDPNVASLVNQIILEAYKKRATDIHIEPYRDKVRFRYRIDGVLVDAHLPPEVKHFLLPILSRIKILANLSITERRLPQDGSAVVKTKEQNLDLRVSTMPTPRGESMVIRILPSKVMLFSLEKLGFDDTSVHLFRELIKKPHGIIFITGPTGSGKTTTLYACLNEINSSQRKIITIEDPVEYEMDGITQVQVNPKVNFTFATGLRSLLRHDPDIIMVGEVRDLETAEIAIRTALTGHLVFSTVHTNDAASGSTRLIDMGVEPYLVASSVEAFVAQRLVRVICPKCKDVVASPLPSIKDEIMQSLQLSSDTDIKIYQGRGCDYCNYTGFYGRVAIYEIIVVNDVIRAAILEKPRSDYIKQVARQEGMITLRQNGWSAVLQGLTTPAEVMNVTVRDEPLPEKVVIQKGSHSGALKEDAPTQTLNQYDLRIYPRTFSPIDIRYQFVKRDANNPDVLIPDGAEFQATTEDFSAGGLRFISKNSFVVGSILELKIQMGEGAKGVECLAKVCRVEEDSLDNVYTIIAYYLDISSADRAAITRFVESKIKEDNKVRL